MEPTTTFVVPLVLAGALLALVLLLRRFRARGAEPAALLYLDEGAASRVFASARYRIRAKPDGLEGRVNDATLVELKSRARGIYPRDEAQIVAATLAVRAGGVHVRRARLETREAAPHALDLDAPDEALVERIRPALEAARTVARGGVPAAHPSTGRCRACGYRTACPFAAAQRTGGA